MQKLSKRLIIKNKKKLKIINNKMWFFLKKIKLKLFKAMIKNQKKE